MLDVHRSLVVASATEASIALETQMLTTMVAVTFVEDIFRFFITHTPMKEYKKTSYIPMR